MIFWQMLYGTLMYFFQIFHVGRNKGDSSLNLIVFVASTNVTWIVFSLYGLVLTPLDAVLRQLEECGPYSTM